MTPARAIYMLDRQLAKHGQDVAFRRGATVTTARGFVRGYKPEQLVGLITQADRQVVMSPTSGFVPAAQDEFITMGQLGRVTAVEPIAVAGVVVRWNLTVRLN